MSVSPGVAFDPAAYAPPLPPQSGGYRPEVPTSLIPPLRPPLLSVCHPSPSPCMSPSLPLRSSHFCLSLQAIHLQGESHIIHVSFLSRVFQDDSFQKNHFVFHQLLMKVFCTSSQCGLSAGTNIPSKNALPCKIGGTDTKFVLRAYGK